MADLKTFPGTPRLRPTGAVCARDKDPSETRLMQLNDSLIGGRLFFLILDKAHDWSYTTFSKN